MAGRVGAGGQVAFAFQIYFGGKDENIVTLNDVKRYMPPKHHDSCPIS